MCTVLYWTRNTWTRDTEVLNKEEGEANTCTEMKVAGVCVCVSECMCICVCVCVRVYARV